MTSNVVAEAKRDMAELAVLLEGLDTSTATRHEIVQVKGLQQRLKSHKTLLTSTTTKSAASIQHTLRNETNPRGRKARETAKERAIRKAMRAIRASEKVDLCFVLDTTGSMAPHIRDVKESVRTISANVRRTNRNFQLRLAVVAYRDFGDTQQFEILDFTSSISVFESFVLGLRAYGGGGDTPEDIAGAIKKATSLQWKFPTRTVFLIADAPCHGTQFHSADLGDKHPTGSPGIDIVQELKGLSGKVDSRGTMSLFFGRINDSTDKMVNIFKEQGVDMKVFPAKEPCELSSSITSSLRSSIMTTSEARPSPSVPSLKSLLGGGKTRSQNLKAYSLSSRVPSMTEWKRVGPVPVSVYRSKAPTAVSQLRSNLTFGVFSMFMRRAPNPFAEGGLRLAYHGQLASVPRELAKSGHEVVMKSFKRLGQGIHDLEQYTEQSEVSTVAKYLATMYNSSSARPSQCGKVEYLDALVVEEVSSENESSGERRFCVERPLPPGEFIKFSNNKGYWNSEHLSETLLRFSLYTSQVSNGYLMLTDLQGVKSGDDYILTDPAILCKDILRFGRTNMGEEFMKICTDAAVAHMEENDWK